MPGLYTGPCKRGVFALSSWEVPLKRPQCWFQEKKDSTVFRPGQKLMMKYNYSANQNSPLGQELTVKQTDFIIFVSQHDAHWIKVANETGDQGYIPASYVMVVQDKVTSLPWLDQNVQEENIKQEAAQYKPYKSAYAPREKGSALGVQEDQSQFYCSVCDKQLNGPIPYRSHLNSKAHKDELEARDMLN